MKQYKDTNYFISKDGLVWNEKHGRFLKTSVNAYGYESIGLFLDKKTVTKRIHRLVAECYIPNPNNYPYINHIDNDKLNNHYTNLEWCTHQMNMDHCTKQNRHCKGNTSGKSKLNDKQVLKIIELYETTELNQTELAKMFNVHQTLISILVCKKGWKHLHD